MNNIANKLGVKISYNNLLKMLIDHDMQRRDLIEFAGVTSNVCVSISKREPIPMAALLKICKAFNCSISDVMEISFPVENLPEEAK